VSGFSEQRENERSECRATRAFERSESEQREQQKIHV
jgi:hypothetical protein